MTSALIASCGGIASAETAATTPAMAPLWTVHIDQVRPGMTAEFERLNALENGRIHAVLRRYGQPIKPLFVIATSGGAYLSLRPRASFTELDAGSTLPDSVSRLVSAIADSLDGPIHAALEHHHNELWRLDTGSTYLPRHPGFRESTPGYVQLVRERVIPRMLDRYGSLVDSLDEALQRSDYPWPVLLFSSAYGDGAYRMLWQAETRERFRKSGDRAAVLAAVYGEATARRMLAAWRSCLVDSETVDAVPRRGYADLDPAVTWPGMAN
ncbi:MAG: hypothetical protein ACHQ52_05985 [Candidatus Eisenbacteria bacterium]